MANLPNESLLIRELMVHQLKSQILIDAARLKGSGQWNGSHTDISVVAYRGGLEFGIAEMNRQLKEYNSLR